MIKLPDQSAVVRWQKGILKFGVDFEVCLSISDILGTKVVIMRIGALGETQGQSGLLSHCGLNQMTIQKQCQAGRIICKQLNQ